MKFHKIWAENVRGISDLVSLTLQPDGLNIVHAPNEAGKTTLGMVPTYLFSQKSSANSQNIKDLKPYGKDVGPLMGAIVEVGGQIYKIEKRWLKDPKTEVELISPLSEKLSGNDAIKVIDKIYKSDMNETIWKMLQIAQADFGSLISEDFSDGQRDTLRKSLDKAVTEEGDEADESFFKKAEAEYLNWWTSTGRQANSAGTRGREIGEYQEKLNTHKQESTKLTSSIQGALAVEDEVVMQRESQEILQRRRDAQELNRELSREQSELLVRATLAEKILTLEESTPAVKTFSPDLYNQIKQDRDLASKYSALASLKLTALQNVSLEINGEKSTLSVGDVRDQKLETPLNITIPSLLSIEYVSTSKSGIEGMETAYKRFTENLTLLGCQDISAAEALAASHGDLLRLKEKLAEFIDDRTMEDISSVIGELTKQKQELPDWDFDVVAPQVSVKDLAEVYHVVGQKEGRAEEISRNGWHTSFQETKEKILDIEKRLTRLNREASASRMLLEVLEKHKASAEKDYSVHFATFLNDVAKSFYGADVHFEVSESFQIMSRRFNGVNVKVEDLSTGAQEQLAILIRLALSRIVSAGESVPVIFDDEFAHTDPERLKLMSKVFTDFGQDQQFIMLTCYPDKFKEFTPAHLVDLQALRTS